MGKWVAFAFDSREWRSFRAVLYEAACSYLGRRCRRSESAKGGRGRRWRSCLSEAECGRFVLLTKQSGGGCCLGLLDSESRSLVDGQSV